MVRTFGQLEGRCNICGEHARLTEDHTPPKGWVRPAQVELQHVVEVLGITDGNRRRTTRSQNGLKYRTLCGGCNNGLLGSRYDPPLIEFANAVGQALRSSIISPVLTFSIQPQAIMRSVIGHLCAQGVERYRKGPKTEAIRDYLLNSALPLPEGMSFYYWAYPFRHQVIARDAVLMDWSPAPPVMFWVMKAYPLAFMVTLDQKGPLPEDVHCLDRCRNWAFEDRVTVTLRMHPLPPERWPEAPADNYAVAYGREAVMASGIGPRSGSR
jgi:hypothetical protein